MSKEQKKMISNHLTKNVNYIKEHLGSSTDLVLREFYIGEDQQYHLAVCYIDGLIDRGAIQEFIFKMLMVELREVKEDIKGTFLNSVSDRLMDTFIPEGQVAKVDNLDDTLHSILSGDTAILIHGDTEGLIISTRGWNTRGMSEPTSQRVVRGPKDSFTETLRMNTAQIRRRIKSDSLWIDSMVIGTLTKTDIAICYVHGVVDEELVKEVKKRLSEISIDGILDSGYIQELISDSPNSPFPTINATERPDTVVGNLLEGRVAIIVDGSPFVLIAPAILAQFMQASEDYYLNYQVTSFTRILRFIALLVSLYTPALYIALVSYNHEMIPAGLMFNIIQQDRAIPFNTFTETIALLLLFEIIHEAGVRMPTVLASSITIVAAIVMGDAAVKAGIVSNVTIIVVAISAVSNFVIPSYVLTNVIRNLRFALFFVATFFGIIGIVLVSIMLLMHLASIRSFGTPYLSPLAPFNLNDQKDIYVRLPLWKMNKRPSSIRTGNRKRQYSKPQKKHH